MAATLGEVIREDELFAPLQGYYFGMELRDEHKELLAVAFRRALQRTGALLVYTERAL